MSDVWSDNEVILSTCAKISNELNKKGMQEAIDIVHDVQYDLIRNNKWRYKQTEEYLGKFFEYDNKVWQVVDCTLEKGKILARDMGFPKFTQKSFYVEGITFTDLNGKGKK